MLAITLLLLESCSAVSTPSTPVPGLQNQSPAVKHNSCPCLYVANYSSVRQGNWSITVYASGASGNAAPTRQIDAQVYGPNDVAVDESGNIYAANRLGYSITVYIPPKYKLKRHIHGSHTALDSPTGVALNPVNGDIYVANSYGDSITIYSSDAKGNVAPTATISGALTNLDGPYGLALDASGNIYVANANNNSITVYSAGSAGNIAPTRTIAGSLTGLDYPTGLALDSNSNIYIANYDNNTLTVYAAGGNGNVAPMYTINGAMAQLMEPDGIALDSSNNIYAANYENSSITVYAAGSNGNVAPINTIEGEKTDLAGPAGIAIH